MRVSSIKSELHFVEFVYGLIQALGYETRRVASNDPVWFAQNAEKLYERLEKLSFEELGAIARFALAKGQATGYRRTSVSDIVPKKAKDPLVFYEEWDGSEPKRELALMVRPVVLAAMYDILATELELDMRRCDAPGRIMRTICYEPQPWMVRFVRKKRPHLASAA